MEKATININGSNKKRYNILLVYVAIYMYTSSATVSNEIFQNVFALVYLTVKLSIMQSLYH